MPFFYGNPGSFASIVETLSASLTVNNATTNPTLIINQTGSAEAVQITQDTDNDCIYVDNNGTDFGMYINQDGVLAASRYALYIYSNSAQVNAELIRLHADNSSQTSGIMLITNDGTGDAIRINQNGVSATNDWPFFLDVAGIQVNSAAMFARMSNASSSKEVVLLQQAGTGPCILLDQNKGQNALEIDQDTNSATRDFAVKIVNDNAGAGLPGGIDMSSFAVDEPTMKFVADAITNPGTLSHQIAIDIGGTTFYLAAYTHGS